MQGKDQMKFIWGYTADPEICNEDGQLDAPFAESVCDNERMDVQQVVQQCQLLLGNTLVYPEMRLLYGVKTIRQLLFCHLIYIVKQ